MTFTDEPAELESYRSLSVWAVVAAALGAASPLAMFGVLLWSLPIAAIVAATVALIRIRFGDGAIIGRKAAWAGMGAGVLFLATAAADRVAYRCLVRREARQFTACWFRLLAEDRPQMAYRLTLSPQYRPPPDDDPWEFYRQGPRWRQELENYANSPLVRTLLALGPRATVRYYDTVDQSQTEGIDAVDLVYAVTFEEQRKKTFFAALRLERSTTRSGEVFWRLAQSAGGVHPAGL